MKIIKIIFFFTVIASMNSCASGYNMINPNKANYISNNESNGVKLEYKYDLLAKKYAKKEAKKGVKVVAIKITNNSNKDIVFGQDAILIYENGNEINILENDKVYKSLKQNTAVYLLYLLLTPMTLDKTTVSGNNVKTSSTPIGFVVGPGIAIGNMAVAGSANKKFKMELFDNNIYGEIIKRGETISGLIGIRSDGYDAIKISVN